MRSSISDATIQSGSSPKRTPRPHMVWLNCRHGRSGRQLLAQPMVSPQAGPVRIALTLKLSVPAGRDDMIADDVKVLVLFWVVILAKCRLKCDRRLCMYGTGRRKEGEEGPNVPASSRSRSGAGRISATCRGLNGSTRPAFADVIASRWTMSQRKVALLVCLY